jgi:hypothetical protein
MGSAGAELHPSSKHKEHSSPGTCFASSSHIVGAGFPFESLMKDVSKEQRLVIRALPFTEKIVTNFIKSSVSDEFKYCI